MTSNDNYYITIEMFNEGLNKIEEKILMLNAGIEKRFDKLENEIKDVKYEIRLNQNDIAHVQTSVYWGFAIIGVIIAFVSLYPFKREKTERSEDLSPRNIRDIRALIREEIRMANPAA